MKAELVTEMCIFSTSACLFLLFIYIFVRLFCQPAVDISEARHAQLFASENSDLIIISGHFYQPQSE